MPGGAEARVRFSGAMLGRLKKGHFLSSHLRRNERLKLTQDTHGVAPRPPSNINGNNCTAACKEHAVLRSAIISPFSLFKPNKSICILSFETAGGRFGGRFGGRITEEEPTCWHRCRGIVCAVWAAAHIAIRYLRFS